MAFGDLSLSCSKGAMAQRTWPKGSWEWMLLLVMSTLWIQEIRSITQKKVNDILVLILFQFRTFSKEPIWEPASRRSTVCSVNWK